MSPAPAGIYVRNTRPEDFPAIIEVCGQVYPHSVPWRIEQLESHLRVFPEGQFVAVERGTERVLGMAASLIIRWADYEMTETWHDFTDGGYFTNHDPKGHTLYGAEVIVRPRIQRRGVGAKLYRARFDLVRRLGLHRIRAGARLRGYHRHAGTLTARDYVAQILRGERKDPTLSFQIRNGFRVFAVVGGYLRNDPESLGHVALIEWLNPDSAPPESGSPPAPPEPEPASPTA